DRADVPGGGHRVPARREDGDTCREREPEADRDPDEVEAPQDEEAADDDQAKREDECWRQRPPPHSERIRALGAEQQEAEDETDARRVEDVAATCADDVLREERDGGGSGEEPPALHAPPVPVLGSGYAEDERDAVAG